MNVTDYDVVLFGCGAYDFSSVAHEKRIGKQFVHLDGVLQLLFAIRCKRRNNPEFAAKTICAIGGYGQLFNSHWVYPGENEKPETASQVEGGCYW